MEEESLEEPEGMDDTKETVSSGTAGWCSYALKETVPAYVGPIQVQVRLGLSMERASERRLPSLTKALSLVDNHAQKKM